MPDAALDVRALLDLPLFAGLTAAELSGLDAQVRTEEHGRGSHLFRRGDHGDALYVVLSGQVALEHRGAGRTELLALCGFGDWFGELALLAGCPRTADARVTVDAVLLRIGRAGWTELGLRAPRIFARLSERLSRQLQATNEPPQAARRAVIACRDATAWLTQLEQSLRRQFPRRPVHLLDAGLAGQAGTARALAGIVAPNAIVLVAGEAKGLADRTLERLGPAEWHLEPPRGTARTAIIRGASPDAALDRVARHVAGGTIGLALGAGGAYGFAHLGLLRTLEAEGIPVDCVAGSSMGAIVGSALAAGVSPAALVAFACSLAQRYRSVMLRDLDPWGVALLRGTTVMRVLGEIDELRHATFADLQLPFVAVATDIRSGEEIVVAEGPVLDGIRPSFAIPGIFPPCVAGERVLVDGAMSNPVPVDRVRDLGADFVIAAQPIPPLQRIAVDPVGSLLGRARWLADLLPVRRLRHGIETLDTSVRSFQALWYRLASAVAFGADVVVRPDLGTFWFLQFGDAQEIIEAGERAAEAEIGLLRTRLAERIGWGEAAETDPGRRDDTQDTG